MRLTSGKDGDVVHNPGFEEGLACWNHVGNLLVTTSGAHSGLKALQMGPGSGWAEQVVPLAPETEYHSVVWAHVQTSSGNVLPESAGNVGLWVFDKSGGRKSYDCPVSKQTFMPCQFTFRTPKDTDYGQLYLWKADAPEELYVDDYEVAPVPSSTSVSAHD